MNRRPKLLFLAYTFPPLQTSACVRTWSIAKYLSRLGWDVTVVTPDMPWIRDFSNNTTIAEKLRSEGIHRNLTDHRWRVLLPNCWKGVFGALATRICRRITWHLNIEPSIGWLKVAEESCRSLTSEDVDVILATGPPWEAFRLAARLADRLGRPYVMDYRDAWTGSPFEVRPPHRITIARERELLRGSAAVTVVSPSSASALDRRFDVGPKWHVVTNGYDPEDLASIKRCEFDHFAIVYTGIFLPPKRVVTPVMAALQLLGKLEQKDTPTWKFHYYGPNEAHVREEAERFAVADRIVCHGQVSRAEAVSAVSGASVAVIVHSIADDGTQEDLGVVPGKTFEPLGLGVPILLIAPPGSDVHEIAKEELRDATVYGQ